KVASHAIRFLCFQSLASQLKDEFQSLLITARPEATAPSRRSPVPSIESIVRALQRPYLGLDEVLRQAEPRLKRGQAGGEIQITGRGGRGQEEMWDRVFSTSPADFPLGGFQ